MGLLRLPLGRPRFLRATLSLGGPLLIAEAVASLGACALGNPCELEPSLPPLILRPPFALLLMREARLASDDISSQSLTLCARPGIDTSSSATCRANLTRAGLNCHLCSLRPSLRKWLSSIEMIRAPSRKNWARRRAIYLLFSSNAGSRYRTKLPWYCLYLRWNLLRRTQPISVRVSGFLSGWASRMWFCTSLRVMG